MSIELNNLALENIKNYKYSTNKLTFIERVVFEPYWNFIASILPMVFTFIFINLQSIFKYYFNFKIIITFFNRD